MTLPYRALFTDPDDLKAERPIQIFASTWDEARRWGDKMLEAGGPNSYVSFFETSERQVSFKRKPQPEAPAA